jgi:hypothetical protein
MDGNQELYPRAVSGALLAALADTPVVCILGPRQCGKTTLTRMLAPARPYFSLDEQNYFQTATADPDGFVESLPDFVTLDEIQRVPTLLPAIKRSVDADRRPGRFLVTGSANLLLLSQVSESLAGRMEVIQLMPLTESEKERREGTFLRELLGGGLKPGLTGEKKGTDLASRLLEGGYPEPLRRELSRARQWHRQYLKALVERDMQEIAQIRDVDAVLRLVELLSVQTGSLLNASGLAQDLGLHRVTVDHYVSLLERLFLVRRLPAWHRSVTGRLVKAPKIHVVDCGLGATLAGVREEDWLERRSLMGHLLESFVVQQVLAQGTWTDPDLRFWHYRDKDKVEVDLVVTRGRSVWGIEVKAAASVGDRDTVGLRRLAGHAGSDFKGGVLLYSGSDILPLGQSSFLAVPLNRLWMS